MTNNRCPTFLRLPGASVPTIATLEPERDRLDSAITGLQGNRTRPTAAAGRPVGGSIEREQVPGTGRFVKMLSKLAVVSMTLGIMLLSQACRGRHRPVALGGGFQSFQSRAAARERLKNLGFTDSWVEYVEPHPKSDSHPEYIFRIISGPFVLLGAQGELRLVFLDDQLMSTEFSTSHGIQAIAAVQKQYPGISIRPEEEISLDDHAKFRYDIPSEGYARLDWHEPEFEDAWSFWIKRYAPAFL